MKFEEGLEECRGHLPKSLLEICRCHFDNDIDLLLSTDGPCVIHRDFHPGNIIASDGKVRGIIDWSSSRGGFVEEDFCPLEFGEWPASCKSSFLEGYASGFTVKRGTWKSRKLRTLSIQSPLS